jgi:GT2 family glycosyltransferase
LQAWSEDVDALSFWRTVAIIPAFGHREVTESTVEQCFREPVDVIVVDNQGDYRPIARETVLEPGRNLGWLGGTVYGWAYALCRDWDYFVLLNNDVRLCRKFFRGLLSARQETGAGIVAPCYDGDFAFQHPSSGIQRASDYAPVDRHLKIGHCDGTAMLVTREVVSKAGMFDPTFSPEYGWGASGDYCIRAKEHGVQVVLTEAAYCEHLGHLTAKKSIGGSYVSIAAREQGKAVRQSRGAEAWHDQLSACSLDEPARRSCDVSVITATKERPEQLEQCCRQLKQQQLGGLSVEHIVVSDGPDARARAIAAEYRARYLVSIKPQRFVRGEALARDVGLRHAQGDYVVFWDDDNEYTDNCVRRLYETARGYDIGIGQTIHCGGNAQSRLIPEDAASAFLFGQIDTMCICVRRQAALRVRWADCLGQYASDFIWMDGLRRTGATFRFRPAPIGVHWATTLGDSI